MGLDQYAWINYKDKDCDEDFYWRKHARLQEFMTKMWSGRAENKGKSLDEFNYGEKLCLTEKDLLKLEKAIEQDYSGYFSPGRFFFGHEFQEESMEEYREQDLDFVASALEKLERDPHSTITYMCSW